MREVIRLHALLSPKFSEISMHYDQVKKQLALFCFHTFKLIFGKPFGSFALPLPQFKFSIFVVVLRVKKAIYEEKEKNLWRGLEFSVCILD